MSVVDRACGKSRHIMTLMLSLTVGMAGCAGNSPNLSSDQPQIEAAEPLAVEPVAPLSPDEDMLLASAFTASAQQDWVASAAQLERLLTVRPDLAWVKARLAWVRQQQGETVEARKLYQDALTQNPSDALTANNLALLLQGESQFEEARAVLEEGLRYSPEVPELHFNLAVLSELYLLDLATALEQYRQYQQLSGTEDRTVAGWIADLERRVQ